jgi:hypothetical protein
MGGGMTDLVFRIGFETPEGTGLVAWETFTTLDAAMQRACRYLDDSAAKDIWIEDSAYTNVADLAAINAYRAARVAVPPGPEPASP